MELLAHRRDPHLRSDDPAPREGLSRGTLASKPDLPIAIPVEHLLAGTNFTKGSDIAVARALERANALGAQLTILHVVENGLRERDEEQTRLLTRERLVTRARSLGSHGQGDISVNVRSGEAWLEILREAIELGSDAIVLGNGMVDGRSAATLIDVICCSEKPVLLAARTLTSCYERAVIALDASAASERVSMAARRLAPRVEARFVRSSTTFAPAYCEPELLMDRVSQFEADLLVVGLGCIQQDTSNTLERLSQRVSESQHCDLLVVKTQGARESHL